MDQDILEFWKRFDTLCRAQDLSLLEVSSLTGISYSNIRNQRTKLILPKTIATLKIAKALNTSVEYLITGSGSEQIVDPVIDIVLKREPLKDLMIKMISLNDKQLAAISTVVDSYMPDQPKHQSQVG